MRRYRTKSEIKFRTGLGLNTRLQRVYSRAQKRQNKNNPHKNNNKDQQGIIIVLVAVFMLGAVGAMAALSIDVVTLYTARSEAQLAADAGALAAARALANSGATSYATSTLMSNAEPMASKVAIQVAQNSLVGGRNLVAANGEVTVSFSDSANTPCVALKPVTNPCVTVAVQRNDLPTFFARIWGSRQIKVAASATAEAYNPTNASGVSNSNPPVAPTCVKPWLLPNLDPRGAGTIFNAVTGAISDPTNSLLGYPSPDGSGGLKLSSAVPPTVAAWQYYAGDPGDFPPPSASSVVCSGCSAFTNPNYQLSIAGCVQKPIACNQTVNVDVTPEPALIRDVETRVAVNGLTHASSNGAGDSVQPEPDPPQDGTAPFQFLAGSKNPLVLSGTLSAEADVMVSDSLVTVPVIDETDLSNFPQVQIIGFLQLFLNPGGDPARSSGGPNNANHVRTTVINMVGCGNGASGTTIPPILGNGASPVAVRLISH